MNECFPEINRKTVITARMIADDELQVFIYDGEKDMHVVMEYCGIEDKSFKHIQELLNDAIPKLLNKLKE